MVPKLVASTREEVIGELAKTLTDGGFIEDGATVAELAPRIGEGAGGLQRLAPLVVVERPVVVPLSFAQQRLWFLDQLEPSTSAYTISAALRLTGLLNVAALAQSLNEIIRRHEALRTTFAVMEGQPVQVITPTLHLSLPVVDLRALPEARRELRE